MMMGKGEINTYINERNFGWLIGGVILVVFLYRYLGKGNISIYWAMACLPFVFLAIFKPGWLTYPLLLWGQLGHYLGLVNTTILLSVLYFLLFVPLSLLFKITRRDLLNRKPDKTRQSYWQAGDRAYPSSLKNQF
jgi:hypothetical protein